MKANIDRNVHMSHCRLLLTSLGIFVTTNNNNDYYITTE
jgi:hypothetical protein